MARPSKPVCTAKRDEVYPVPIRRLMVLKKMTRFKTPVAEL